jgi:hypothetical protein
MSDEAIDIPAEWGEIVTDPLTHDERLRVEAMELAIKSIGTQDNTNFYIARAMVFEKFLKDKPNG